jgi:HEAT repeat protein
MPLFRRRRRESTPQELAIEALLRELNSEDPALRRGAAGTLGDLAVVGDEWGTLPVIPPLVASLSDPDETVVQAAAHALVGFGEEGRRALEAAFDNLPARARPYAAVALWQVGGEARAFPLRDGLHDPRPFVRDQAGLILGRAGESSAVGPLVRALSGGERGRALSVLEELVRVFQSPDVPSHLIRALTDPDPKIVIAAEAILGRLDDPRIAEALRATAGARHGGQEAPIDEAWLARTLEEELLDVYASEGFLGAPVHTFDEDGRNIHARAIGAELNAIGGYDLMLQVAKRVVARSGCLESVMSSVWDRIGSWSA